MGLDQSSRAECFREIVIYFHKLGLSRNSIGVTPSEGDLWDWGHMGWVRTGNFGDFSTNKPAYLRNSAR